MTPARPRTYGAGSSHGRKPLDLPNDRSQTGRRSREERSLRLRGGQHLRRSCAELLCAMPSRHPSCDLSVQSNEAPRLARQVLDNRGDRGVPHLPGPHFPDVIKGPKLRLRRPEHVTDALEPKFPQLVLLKVR